MGVLAPCEASRPPTRRCRSAVGDDVDPGCGRRCPPSVAITYSSPSWRESANPLKSVSALFPHAAASLRLLGRARGLGAAAALGDSPVPLLRERPRHR